MLMVQLLFTIKKQIIKKELNMLSQKKSSAPVIDDDKAQAKQNKKDEKEFGKDYPQHPKPYRKKQSAKKS